MSASRGPKQEPDQSFTTPAPDEVDIASNQSFPASDPPAWNAARHDRALGDDAPPGEEDEEGC